MKKGLLLINVLKTEPNDIRKYLLYLKSKKCNNNTIDGVRRILNVFYRFLLEEGYISINPCKNIDKVKLKHEIKYTPNDLDIEILRDSCKTSKEIALIDFLLSTGLRVMEVSNVKVSDIDWNKMIVLVHGKGDKDRIVPFSTRCKKHLEDYLTEREILSEYLFSRDRRVFDLYGNEIDSKPSKSMINSIINKIRSRCGLNNVTVHSIRRYVAQYLDSKNVDGSIIQDLLGHSNYRTTKESYIGSNMNKIITNHRMYAM